VAQALIQNYKMGVLNRTDLAKLSLSNQYQVYISGIPTKIVEYLKGYEVENSWINKNIGLLCADATLPTSSFATAEVKDNFQGVTQQFAHTRLYVDSDFTFYVDYNYYMIKFFEGWMDFIAGRDDQSVDIQDKGYYRRFNYPEDYKTNNLTITKFERDYKRSDQYLQYNFVNAFPKAMTAIPVSYGQADLVKVTVSFAYDRYYIEVMTKNEETAKEPLNEETQTKTTPKPRNTDGTIVTRGGTKIPQGNFKSSL